MVKILELFGGIGAPRKALINLGIDHKAIDYVEIDEKRVRAYNALYDHSHKPQSVIGYNLRPDILVHGSPCQDFSRGNKNAEGGKKGSGTRSSMLHETVKIISNMGVWKPKVVIWENVTGVLEKKMVEDFTDYLSDMEEQGYTNSQEVLNSMDFGIPQSRNRVFVVSMLDDLVFDFSKLERKPLRPITEFLEKDVHEKYTITSPSMLSRIEGVDTKSTFGGRLKPIETHCWTITTKQNRCPNSGIVHIGNGIYRLLTERECWRLMGFDDDDFEAVLKEHPGRGDHLMNGILYELAGNSIVVDVLEAIFKVLLTAKHEKKDFVPNIHGQLEMIC